MREGHHDFNSKKVRNLLRSFNDLYVEDLSLIRHRIRFSSGLVIGSKTLLSRCFPCQIDDYGLVVTCLNTELGSYREMSTTSFPQTHGWLRRRLLVIVLTRSTKNNYWKSSSCRTEDYTLPNDTITYRLSQLTWWYSYLLKRTSLLSPHPRNSHPLVTNTLLYNHSRFPRVLIHQPNKCNIQWNSSILQVSRFSILRGLIHQVNS